LGAVVKRALSIVAGLAVAAGAPAAAHAAAAKPKVVGLTASVKHLAADGGKVALHARVRAARTCVFTETRAAKVVATRTVGCSSGAATVTLTTAPNTTKARLTLRFAVRATSTAGSARAAVSIVQDGIAPLAVIAAGPLSPGIVGNTYSTVLLADGGAPSYTWTLVSGSLPDGLALGADGTIAGTPTTAEQASFTARVIDGNGDTATGDFTLSVTDPASSLEQSTNWSGYIERGGPFTSVSGTFNVPTVDTTAGTDNSQWVGIDGDSNSDLIQAGVAESVSSFSGRVQIYAWWEILPAPETPISMPIAAGDSVSVSIGQVEAGTWTIKISDLTSGRSFSKTVAYSGATTSAEWILEAPTSGRGRQTSLASFTPAVTFGNLGLTGTVTEIAAVEMVQHDVTVAEPSPLGANGFSVAFGSVAPPAP
jgi:hypothetical protein